jgi:hypothetical protein
LKKYGINVGILPTDKPEVIQFKIEKVLLRLHIAMSRERIDK